MLIDILIQQPHNVIQKTAESQVPACVYICIFLHSSEMQQNFISVKDDISVVIISS
jgi:hypothetical protein